MGFGRKVHGEEPISRTFAMLDFASLAIAFALFTGAALYARACGQL
ncbi:MAG: hypothetical protein OEL76_05275 [Siculibacillus sp.]|nr:hypothetical protein [Siculibacillus sp.]